MGACLVALGPHVAGLMTNNDPWGERVLSAVGRAGERAWKLPLDASYDEMIRSKVADMRTHLNEYLKLEPTGKDAGAAKEMLDAYKGM